MNPEGIQNALIEVCRLIAIGRGLSPHLPGVEYERVTVPGVIFDYRPSDRPNVDLAGKIRHEIGDFHVIVVVRTGASATDDAHGHAFALAQALETAAYGVPSLTITGGKIDITKPVMIRTGFPDGVNWRVPAVARYEARSTS